MAHAFASARLHDGLGRRFEYLRLSVTDACNFRCVYCLPNGYQRDASAADAPLRIDEVRRLVTAFAAQGLWKVRLTGGEPTLRKDIVQLAETVAAVPGVSRVALSTNGYRLAELALPLADAGVSRVNVSLDSLSRETFARITGNDRLHAVRAGIDRALAVGLQVKVNVVLLSAFNARDANAVVDEFLPFVQTYPVVVRFIQLMQTGDNRAFFDANHLPLDGVRQRLLAHGFEPRERRPGDGPAQELTRGGDAGGFGLIAPYESGFCSHCNRLRVTSRGKLRLCLFGDGEYALRSLLQRDDDAGAVIEAVRQALLDKTATHALHAGKTGRTKNLSVLGG